MNLIGLAVPYILLFASIWINSADINIKVILSFVAIFNLILSFDYAKPSHRGWLTSIIHKIFSTYTAEIILLILRLIPFIAIECFSIYKRVWICTLYTAVCIITVLIEIVDEVKDKIKNKK